MKNTKKILFLSFLLPVICFSAVPESPPVRFPDSASWGVQIHTPCDPTIMETCHMPWVRIQGRWMFGEPEKGKYDFTQEIKLVEYYKQFNCNILFLLDSETMSPDYAAATTDEIIEGMSNWHAAVAAALKDYGQIVFEIGNEPEVFPLGNRWNNPEIYTRLALASARKIRQSNPNALIGACSVAWVDRPFLTSAMENGLLSEGTIDFITFHGYHRKDMCPESGLAEDVKWMRELIAKYAPANHYVDIIDSERGYAILPSTRLKHRDNWRNHAQTVTEQAAYLARHYIEENYLGLEISIWYKDINGEEFFALAGDESNGLRLHGLVYRNLSGILDKNPKLMINNIAPAELQQIPADLPEDLQPYLRTFYIEDGSSKRIVAALWFPVEAFDGKIIDYRKLLPDASMEEVWRDITPDDTVEITVDLAVDVSAFSNIKTVKQANLTAQGKNTFIPVNNVAQTDTTLLIKDITIGPMPTVFTIEVE